MFVNTWEAAVRLLKMQGRVPTIRDKELFDAGYRSHIMFAEPNHKDWGRETKLMKACHVEED